MDTSSEKWRRECEARWVLQHNAEWRQGYYVGVAKHRGQAAAEQLVEDVKLERRKHGTENGNRKTQTEGPRES